MKKSEKKFERKVLALALCSFMTVGLAACGKTGTESDRKENQEQKVQQQQQQQQQEELPEYVYQAKFSELSGVSSMRNSQYLDGYLYSLESDYDESTGKVSYALKKYPLGENGLGEAEEGFALPETETEGNFTAFAMDTQGNRYFVQEVYPALAEGEEMPDDYWEQRTYHLVKYDSQGESVYDTDITDIIKSNDDNNSWIQAMAVDGQGRICLSFSNLIRLFDAEGKAAGDASLGTGWIQGMGTGKDGKIYLTYYGPGTTGTVLAPVDFEGKGIGSSYDNFPGNGGLQPCMMDEKNFIVTDSNSVFQYNIDTKTSEKLFDWLDCDIDGSNIEKIEVLNDGRLLAAIRDWNMNTGEIALLDKVPSSEVVQKETITIGTLYNDTRLQREIVAFNKSSDSYRIRLITYLDDTVEWTENTYSDAIAAMNNAITSGNCPDILSLQALDIESLAKKGVFEDLYPWLEKSTQLDQADYYGNLLQSMTYDDKLVAIPYSFSLQTMVGKAADVGQERGWKLQDIMEFAKEHPGVELFDYATQEYVLSVLLNMNQKLFMDKENGKCSFDSQEFKDLLAFAATFPSQDEYQADSRPNAYKIAEGKLLLETTYISEFRDIQMLMAEFNNEPITFIGYPNPDGKDGVMMNISDTYAISSQSAKKEAAWEFLEGMLVRDPEENAYFYGFPARKSQFKKMREEATKIEYVINPETGEPYLDEDGEPIVQNSGGSVSYMSEDGEDWTYEYHITTEEEADLVEDLIASATNMAAYTDSQIMSIISEEAAPYFKGQKSVEEVTNIIQSRISLYMLENQ